MSPNDDLALKLETNRVMVRLQGILSSVRIESSPRAFSLAMMACTAAHIAMSRDSEASTEEAFVDSCIQSFRRSLEQGIFAMGLLRQGQPLRPRPKTETKPKVSQELEKERAKCEAYHRRNEDLKRENERLQATMRHLAVTLQALAQVPNLPAEALAMLEGIPENLRKAARPGQVEQTQPGDSA